jgi:hypothetical protein
LRLNVLELCCLDSTKKIKVAGKLIVADGLGFRNLADEVAGFFIKILLDVVSNDDVDQGGLSDLVKVETGCLVRLEHLWSDLG